MEKTKNRTQYLKQLNNFVNDLELTKDFIEKLESHKYFPDYADSLRVCLLSF